MDLFLVQKAIPAFWNTFVPIQVQGKTKSGEIALIEYLVAPDYLSLGTDQDFIRIPLAPLTAQKIADAMACLLPTKRMVDQIYEKAPVKLDPRPYQPKIGEPGREDSRIYKLINDKIQGQLLKLPSFKLGTLLGGHKKDVVITNQLLKNPKKVAIYGWHTAIGKPIQPLYLGHGDYYVDYSHGIRLVANRCKVNGVEMDLGEVLRHKDYGSLLTGDAPLQIIRYT